MKMMTEHIVKIERTFSAIAAAAEVPLNTEEYQMSKVCRTKVLSWGIGLSGGVLRTRLSEKEFIEMMNSGVGMGTEKCCLRDDDEGDDGSVDMMSAPPGNMFG